MYFLLVFLLSFPLFANEQNCAQYAEDCEFYTCIAKEKNCDKKSYPTSFGHRYCKRFEKRMDQFSEAGKRWVLDVKRCLINEMMNYDESLSCHEFKVKAFEDHTPCYRDNGFCDLSETDRLEVIKTVYPSFKDLRVVTGAYQLFKSCQIK